MERPDLEQYLQSDGIRLSIVADMMDQFVRRQNTILLKDCEYKDKQLAKKSKLNRQLFFDLRESQMRVGTQQFRISDLEYRLTLAQRALSLVVEQYNGAADVVQDFYTNEFDQPEEEPESGTESEEDVARTLDFDNE